MRRPITPIARHGQVAGVKHKAYLHRIHKPNTVDKDECEMITEMKKREARTARMTIRLRPIAKGFISSLAETESHRLGRRVSSADIIEMLVMREMRRHVGASGCQSNIESPYEEE
jgi:hypothetical protein